MHLENFLHLRSLILLLLAARARPAFAEWAQTKDFLDIQKLQTKSNTFLNLLRISNISLWVEWEMFVFPLVWQHLHPKVLNFLRHSHIFQTFVEIPWKSNISSNSFVCTHSFFTCWSVDLLGAKPWRLMLLIRMLLIWRLQEHLLDQAINFS